MGGSGRWLVVGGVALALAGAWQYRDRLKALLPPPAASAEHAMAQPDVLYSWVDQAGVTHYEQRTGRGQRVEFDGGRITPLAPVDPALAGRVRKAAGSDEPVGGEAAGTLQGLREELQSGAQAMQQAQSARRDL